jgi:hypothetical protein
VVGEPPGLEVRGETRARPRRHTGVPKQGARQQSDVVAISHHPLLGCALRSERFTFEGEDSIDDPSSRAHVEVVESIIVEAKAHPSDCGNMEDNVARRRRCTVAPIDNWHRFEVTG